MKNNYSTEVKKLLKQAEKEMYDLHHPYVGSEHLLLAILKNENKVLEVFKKYGLTYDSFRKDLIACVGKSRKKSEIALYTPLLKRILSDAESDAHERANKTIEIEDLVLSLLEEGEGIAIRILLNMDIDLEGVYNDISQLTIKPAKASSLLVYEIGREMNGLHKNEKIYKREKEIQQIIEILLRKNKNNPLLIGEAGVGKTAIVEELARLIDEKKVPEFLENYKIIELDTGSLISGTRYRGDFEDRLNKIIKEIIEEKNIILFIDEIHTLVNCGGAEGAIDAANILKPYLARGTIKIIGATTIKEYKNSIQKDKALERRFEIVNVDEPTLKDTEYILQNIKDIYEKHHNVIISDQNIKDIVKYTDKYIFNRFNPDKSIDILDSVCAHVQYLRPNNKNALTELNKKKEKLLSDKKYKEVLETELQIRDLTETTDRIPITKNDILKVIEYRANMPVLDYFNDKLNKLNETLKKIIYGQDSQIDKICDLLKEKYLVDNSKPLSILITGPSGCGKSFTAKTIANKLFGEKHFLKLEMSEFSNESTISKLLGTTQGYIGYEDDCLLNKIKDYPYSIILLDDIEKSPIAIQNIFSKIIEEGQIQNGKGETIHFENTSIIMTSNQINKNIIGFERESNNLINEKSVLVEKVNCIIEYNKIDIKSAKKYLNRETDNLKLSKDKINDMIKNANIGALGMRGLQKEINKYKISQIMTKV